VSRSITNPVYELFDPGLQAPPLELHRNEFIAAHNRTDGSIPVRADQRTPVSLAGFELCRILIPLVILATNHSTYAIHVNRQTDTHLLASFPGQPG